ncbi:MAG: GumN family protein [Sediminibacterium sp.]|nr:GumN family protein [Sediminibacterium sp.]
MVKNALMRRACFFLWVFLLAVTAGTAQSGNNSLLYEISGNGIQQPSYLFGTFHILCKDDFPVPGILAEKIRSSKKFYGELKLDDPNLQLQLMGSMMLKDQTLESLMTPEEYTKVSSNFQQITGMPMMMFSRFKPFVGLSLLAIRSIDCPEQVQPESLFVSLAKENHVEILGLESVMDQVNAINREPLDSQVNSFRKMVMNFDSVKHMMAEMVAIYKQRNVDSLYAFMKTSGAGDDFEAAMITGRNRKWVPLIAEAVKKDPVFIAVGAGHLGGQEGVIMLLRKQGFNVRPVMY